MVSHRASHRPRELKRVKRALERLGKLNSRNEYRPLPTSNRLCIYEDWLLGATRLVAASVDRSVRMSCLSVLHVRPSVRRVRTSVRRVCPSVVLVRPSVVSTVTKSERLGLTNHPKRTAPGTDGKLGLTDRSV